MHTKEIKTYQVHDPHRVLERLRLAVLVVARRLRLEGNDARLMDDSHMTSTDDGERVICPMELSRPQGADILTDGEVA